MSKTHTDLQKKNMIVITMFYVLATEIFIATES